MFNPHPVATNQTPFPDLTPPVSSEGEGLISVSTRFNPKDTDFQDADMVLLAKDHVYFYVHRNLLLRQSSNQLGSLLLSAPGARRMGSDGPGPGTTSESSVLPPTIPTEYPSDVLNVILHFIYGYSVECYRPSPSTLRAACDGLFALGYNLDNVFTPHSEPYMLFLQAGVSEPLAMYALAAQYSLESLAVAVSTFTISVPPSDITDELAVKMGPIYLRRLFFLYLGRTDALRRLLYPPPAPHPTSSDLDCDYRTQQEVSRIWALACASVVIDNHPSSVIGVFAPLSAQLPCTKCRETLQERVTILIRDWSSIKNTI